MDLGLNDGSETKNNNTLSIRLTESAVFLTTDGRRSQSRARDTTEEQRSTLLRGLLILQLVKPTRITSIDVELTATSSISWPEGDTIQSLLFNSNILFLYI
jgi:hypothetical protein